MSEQILVQILEDLRGVKGELGGLKTELGELKGEFGELRDEVNNRIDGFEKQLHLFREETRADLQVLKAEQIGFRKEMSDPFDEFKRESSDHKYAIDLLNHKQFEIEVEVQKLKEKI